MRSDDLVTVGIRNLAMSALLSALTVMVCFYGEPAWALCIGGMLWVHVVIR